MRLIREPFFNVHTLSVSNVRYFPNGNDKSNLVTTYNKHFQKTPFRNYGVD